MEEPPPPNTAKAWEMESSEGAVRSSSRESDRQMGSEGDEEGRCAPMEDPMERGGFRIHGLSWGTGGSSGLDR